MKKDKKQAEQDFIRMIEKSWTYGRMTEAERKRWWGDAFWLAARTIGGNYTARYTAYNAVYSAFLDGLGYDGPRWRGEDERDYSFMEA